MRLPTAAADALALPPSALSLELHVISFSHYCARAKWYVGACGLKADVFPLLPLQHVPHMIALLKRFRAPRASPTASSRSPAATPALAIYRRRENDNTIKTPVALLQDSELIGRWAALRAQALGDGGAAARALYGRDARLSVAVEEEEEEEERVEADGATKKKKRRPASVAVLEYDDDAPSTTTPPADLERRLSGALGVESRRLIYFHLLPARALFARTCALNAQPSLAGGGGWGDWYRRSVAAPLWALAASFALPGLLGVSAANVERGMARLDAEFAYLDALILERGCLVSSAGGEERVGAFLCGDRGQGGPSVADISLAALAAPLAGDVAGYGAHLPAERDLPEALRRVLREKYSGRPTARYARALWREYGAAAVSAATAGGGGDAENNAPVASRL